MMDIEKINKALDEINEAHDMLADSSMDIEEYQPISSKLVQGKIKLAELIAENSPERTTDRDHKK